MKIKYLLLFFLMIVVQQNESFANDTLHLQILEKAKRAATLQLNDPDSAMVLAYEILNESKRIGHLEGEGYAFVRIGSVFNLRGNNDSSLYYLEKAFEIRMQLENIRGAASIKRLMGEIYKQNGQIDLAFSSLYQSVRLIESTKDSSLIVQSYLELAHTLCDYNELSKAKEYYDKSFEIASQTHNRYSMAYCYEGYGKYDLHQENYQKALSHYLKAAELYNELENLTGLSNIYNNMAVCYDKLDQKELAIIFYKNALELYITLGLKRQAAICQYNIALLYDNMNELDSSILYHNNAIQIAHRIEDLNQQHDSYKELASVYAQLGDYVNAYQNYLTYSSIKDSLLNKEKLSSIAEMQTKYETEKKEQQIELLAEQNKAKEAQRNFLLAASAVLVLTVFVLGFFYVQRKRIAKKNELIARQKIESLMDEQEIKTYNAMLEGQEEERLRIAADLHDRLGSMLSTVKLLFSALDEKIDKHQEENKQQYEKANHLLDEACNEVRRVAHNLGTGMVANFGLSKAVEELCESIDQSGKIKCQVLSYGVEDASLTLNLEIGIYRMVQEIVNNAMKHSNAQTLSVQFNVLEDVINITIEDDGVGFDLAEAIKKGGMGIGNLEKRAMKLGGNVHIDTRKGKGTTTIIELPINLEV